MGSGGMGSGGMGPVSRAVREYVVGMTQVKIAVLTSPWRRDAYNRWGAVDSEVFAPMPGDDLVPTPRLGYTRAITIDAPPAAVWPWLVQIGQGRGGLYSFDALENLVGCRIHSADAILPEHQAIAVGDLVRMGPEGYPCFAVIEATPPSPAPATAAAVGTIRRDIREEPSPHAGEAALVLLGADPKPPHATPPPGETGAAGASTWQFVLRPLDGGRRARLVVRQRLDFADAMAWVWRLTEPIAFAMEREMLRGIKRRAEAIRQPSPNAGLLGL